MKPSVLTFFIAVFFLTSFSGVSQNKQNPARSFEFPAGAGVDQCIPGKAIVKINAAYSSHCEKNGVTHPAFSEALKSVQAVSCVRRFPRHSTPVSKTGNEVDLSLIYEVGFSKQIPVQDAVNSLLASGILDYAQPRYYVYKLDTIPSDPLNFQQYHLPLIRAFSAWDISMGDTSVLIGITDWGTDVDHPDLVGNFAYNKEDPVDGIDNDNDGYTDNYLGWDMGDNDNNPQETIDHGTRVCGIAAASTSNGTGVSGVGFRCRLLPVKIADAAGYGTMGFEGIVYAADAGCKVINCSWGSVFYPGPYGQDIINYATYNRDALVVAAAGNSGNIDKYFPASYDNVISVAGTNASDLIWSGSTYGTGIDICAPGHNVWSTRNGGTYDYAPGTSFAAPIVSGCAAIVRSYYPSLSAVQTGHLLKVTADVIDTMSGNLPFVGLLGSGRVNLYSALQGINSPSVEMSAMHYADHDNNGSFTPGDTISLYGTITNYLSPSSSVLTAVLTSASPYITMLDSVFMAGSIPTLGTTSNQSTPFRFLIKHSMPPGAMIDFKISYSDGSYSARQYFFKTLYVNYLTVDTNRVALTLTGNSMLGYNSGNSLQGVGFTYDQHPTMLFSGGLVAGVSSTQVSDVVYGFTGTYDQDFINVQPIGRVYPPSKAEHETITVFSDSLAGNSAMGLQVTQKSYAWGNAPDDKYIILEYNIVHKGVNPLNAFYAGLFLDWDIINSMKNSISFDAQHRLSYCFPFNGGTHTGISLLTPASLIHYAFDNNGSNSSLNITDGFSGYEKYVALKTQRPAAGIFYPGNDVSSMISSGPYQLNPGDTLVLAWVVMAGNHLADLQSSVVAAREKYFNTGAGIPETQKLKHRIVASPNPTTGKLTVEVYSEENQNAVFTFTDMSGSVVIPASVVRLKQGMNTADFNLTHYPAGLYNLSVTLSGITTNCRISVISTQ